ncbi:hypothetical protein NURINAE_01018 [Candidatus Nitrosacidococcus sp. I8]|nr:hypothetical protein NURINAE_01018 [Candidatus Nitrosacidococcus sp. I8]
MYQSNQDKLAQNIQTTIRFYNQQREQFHQAFSSLSRQAQVKTVNGFINHDSTQINWVRSTKENLIKNQVVNFDPASIVTSLYRPFTKQWMYFSRDLNEMVYQMPQIFPYEGAKNVVIAVTGRGATKEFSAMITNVIPDLEMISKGQCFPLYLYEKVSSDKQDLFAQHSQHAGYHRADGIENEILTHFQKAYPKNKVCKVDIFYYIYEVLHCENYRGQYKDNLSKQLPRIFLAKMLPFSLSFPKQDANLLISTSITNLPPSILLLFQVN